MADITLTPASVLSRGKSIPRAAGATLVAGDVVYDDAGSMKLADNDSGTPAARSVKGIALNGAATGQPVQVHTAGQIVIGGTLVAGTAYYLSGTPGKICPVGDLSTGDYPVVIGIAISTTVLDVNIQEAGVAL